MTTDFPDDLVQLQRRLHVATAAYKQALDDTTNDWASGNEQAGRDLPSQLAHLRDLIERVHMHPYWDTLSGPDLVKARMALKHVDDQPAGD
ncbi:hypothetical protein [Streptomyces lydicus]|uniref:hypothetical protein n=1 Tax=Streptomyces lydicus TaxID=47763 RepID=UPI0036E0B85E